MHDILATSFPGLFVQEKQKIPLILEVSATYRLVSYLLQSRLVTNL